MNYPTITLDRVETIANAMIDARLATWNTERDGALSMEPVMRAELARHGVGKIGRLSVDQAEKVESFIGAYAQNTAPDRLDPMRRTTLTGDRIIGHDDGGDPIRGDLPVHLSADGESVLIQTDDGVEIGLDQGKLVGFFELAPVLP